MRDHTSFRIGGPADLYAAPATQEELAALLAACREDSVGVFLLGGGTNILVSDRGVRGLVIDLSLLRDVAWEGPLVTAAAGAAISEVAELAAARGLAGLEFAYRLPGSVGGAVWMNARCYDSAISDILVSADYLDDGLAVRRLPNRPGDWGYKVSPFQRMRDPILSATFRLTPGDPGAIRAAMTAHQSDRERKGHFLYPCAGSIFKNNRDFGGPTGKLIDSLGLKGRRIGGAQIAPFHGNIIINLGRAAAADVLSLMELVEGEVSRSLGYRLEREVVLVGEW